MPDSFNLNMELGPLFTVKVEQSVSDSFTLEAGVKSSSLFQGGGGSFVQSTNITVTITTAQSLSLYRAVTFSGVYCEPTAALLSQYAGVTTVAVGPGEPTKVVQSGLITEGGWSWTPNAPVFVGAGGVLTQASGSLPIRRIGWAMSATQIAFDPFPIIGA